MENEVFENELIKLRIVNNILYAQYKKEEIDFSIAKAATIERQSFSKGKAYPILVDYSLVKKTSKEARDYFAKEEASQGITAMATIISSPVGSMIANFYIKFSKPSFPFKIFTDIEKAKGWLFQYL